MRIVENKEELEKLISYKRQEESIRKGSKNYRNKKRTQQRKRIKWANF
mgnify:CR=1 FL=1